jgi:hypothetical protein
MSKYALLIGCNYFGRNRLRGCHNDVYLMKKILSDQGYMVVLCTDEATSVKRFSSQNTLDWFLRNRIYPFDKNIDFIFSLFARHLKVEDKLFFHFSGHGAQNRIPTTASDPFENDGFDETIVVYRKTRGLALITDNSIHYHFNQILCPIFYVFDSCHSASVADLTVSYTSAVKYDEHKQGSTKKQRDLPPVSPFPKGEQDMDKNKNLYVPLFSHKSKVAESDKVLVYQAKVEPGKQNINKRVLGISGCFDKVYSFDTFITEKKIFHGSLTYCLSQIVSKSFSNSKEMLDDLTEKIYALNKSDSQTPVLSFSNKEFADRQLNSNFTFF